MKITIIGLGWLGQSLAVRRRQKRDMIFGTTTTAHKLNAFKQSGYRASLFDLYQQLPEQIDENYFADSTIVLNIPPGRKNFDAQQYTQRMISLIEHAFSLACQKIIFISTTSVFNGHVGLVTNDTATAATTESGKAHVLIEQYLLSNYPQAAVILRPSGLVGDNRHPVISMSGRKGIELGRNPINLVHRTDVLNAIEAIIEQDVCGRAFNISSLKHPSRAEYYTWCAKQLKLPPPEFAADTRDKLSVKIIDARKTYSQLGIKPAYADPHRMLPHIMN